MLPSASCMRHHGQAAGDGWGSRMGFRFRKSVRILPGVRVNLSKSGISASIGGIGATVNIGSRGTRTTVGVPGTGLSYSAMKSPSRPMNDVGRSNRVGPAAPTRVNGCVALFGGAGFLALLAAIGLHAPSPSPVDGNEVMPMAMSTPAIVSARTLTCRQTPDPQAARITRYHRGAQVTVVGTSGAWSEVDRGSSKCWLMSAFLTDAAGLAAPGASPSLSGAQGLATMTAASRTDRSHRSSSRAARGNRRSGFSGGACPCSGGNVCIGPRGGRFCITSGGNKRYGV